MRFLVVIGSPCGLLSRFDVLTVGCRFLGRRSGSLPGVSSQHRPRSSVDRAAAF